MKGASRRLGRRLALILFGVGVTLFVADPRAASPLIWHEPPHELTRGEADGVAVSSRGVLFPAPRLNRLGAAPMTGEPNQIFSMVSDDAGNLFLGTGPEGRILRVTPAGEQSIHFTVDEPLVTALTITPDGTLIAGTAPGGRVYRIEGRDRGELWSETEERYIWALAAATDGTVFAGTGERGAVLRISGSGRSEIFFDGDEAHIMALLHLPGGRLLAGGAGRGLVYEIDAMGNGAVLYEGDLPEVTALGVDGEGNVLAAFVASPEPEKKPPALRLRLPDGVQVGKTNESVGTLEESSGPVLQGYIEGLEGGARDASQRYRGRLVRIDPDGRSAELWSSRSETPFSILCAADGELFFGTGEPARLHRIDRAGDVALLASLPEGQTTGLRTVGGGGVVLATSNPASVYRFDGALAEAGVYLSHPFDAGAPARWGAIRWKAESGDSGRIEIYTRTGNSRDPDGTWSAWSPALTDPRASRIDNPDGRYLQWRARFPGAQREGSRLSSVTLHYEPYNRPPAIRDFDLVGTERALSESPVLRWKTLDPDGDPVETSLAFRPLQGGAWQPLAIVPVEANGKDRRDLWIDERYEWDTTSIPEGRYELRAVVSDAGANPPGEGAERPAETTVSLAIDRSAPGIELSTEADGSHRVAVADEFSEIRRLQLVIDGRSRYTARPVDGVYDSKRELFRLAAVEATGDVRLVAWDAAGNRAEQPLREAP